MWDFKAIVISAVAGLGCLAFSQAALAAPDFTHVRIRGVASTQDAASQRVTFDVVRVGQTPLNLAGRKVTVRDNRGRVRTAVLDADSDGTASTFVVAYSSIYFAEDDDSGWGGAPQSMWLPPRFLPVDGGTLTVEGMDEWSFGPLPFDGSWMLRDGTQIPMDEYSRKDVFLVVREYHHAGMDHYLLTANAAEFDALDSGDVPGWRPTGIAIYAHAVQASPQFVPVCRFLLLYPAGYSHFMTSFDGECAALAKSDSAILETRDAFYVAASDEGSCPDFQILLPDGRPYRSGSTGMPIYRLWNGKAEANHRYVGDKATRDAMVGRGWVSEGAGADGVAMCGYTVPDPFLANTAAQSTVR